jgi:uncharacterized protein involved in exopolysaccharide biosynthesis
LADEKILIDMAKMLGAVDSKLDSVERSGQENYNRIHEEVREFRAQYNQNAQTNRDHSIKVEARLNDLERRKLDRDDPELEPARKFGWIINNWKWVLLAITIAAGIGIKLYRPSDSIKLDQAKETVDKILGGKKSEGHK